MQIDGDVCPRPPLCLSLCADEKPECCGDQAIITDAKLKKIFLILTMLII